jgi:hypothetical protein
MARILAATEDESVKNRLPLLSNRSACGNTSGEDAAGTLSIVNPD